MGLTSWEQVERPSERSVLERVPAVPGPGADSVGHSQRRITVENIP